MSTSTSQKKHLCQSCHCVVEENEYFCSVCGQKKITKPATFQELFKEAFSNFFSIDSKLSRTLLPLFFLPGKLTNEYLAGKRNLYYTPIKLFLFWMTLAFILLNSLIVRSLEENKDMDRNINVHVQANNDSLQTTLNNIFTDSLSQQKITQVFDSFKTTEEEELNLDIFELSIDRKDILVLSYDELLKKYKVEDYWLKQIVLQLAKAIKHPDDFQFYLFSHLSWLILFSIPLIIIFLKLLYIRQKKYYVEHAIFILQYHAFLFGWCSILFCWLLWQGKDYELVNSILWSIFIVLLYFIISLKTVYKQGIIKTLFKFLIFSVGYTLIIAISILGFLILTVSLY